MDVQETASGHGKIFETHPLHVKIIIKIKPEEGEFRMQVTGKF